MVMNIGTGGEKKKEEHHAKVIGIDINKEFSS